MGKLRNIAFIDGQNLAQNMRNAARPWKLDLIKFRTFLKDKYNCDKVYYFIGFEQESNENLYKFLQHVGYEVVFREHDPKSKGTKKTNVDTDKIDSKYVVKLYHKYNKSILELKK